MLNFSGRMADALAAAMGWEKSVKKNFMWNYEKLKPFLSTTVDMFRASVV